MLEELQKLELMSLDLSSQLMLIAGGLMLAGGLLVWIGGMQWRFLTALLVGVLFGGISILFVNEGYHGQAFGIAAVAGFVYIILFKKRGMVLIGAILAALVCALAATPTAADVDTANHIQNPDYPLEIESNESLSAEESFKVLKSQYVYLGREFLGYLKETGTGGIITAIVIAFLVGVGGFVFSKIVSAAATSAVGTLFIFAGMVVMLLQKGSAPITLLF